MTRVILYSKPDCSLCDEAKEMLAGLGEQFEVQHDPLYDERVPVIEIDGKIVTEGRVSQRAVTRALKRR